MNAKPSFRTVIAYFNCSKPFFTMLLLTAFMQQASAQFANRALSNLTSPTAANTNLLPGTNNTYNLGSAALRWKSLYLTNLVFAGGSTQTTAFVPYTAGIGISIAGTVITNTRPDVTVSIAAGSGISVTGTYPNFTVSSSASTSPWLISGSNIYYNAGNVGIGTAAPAKKLEVAGSDALVYGVTVGRGSGNDSSNTVLGQYALRSNTSGFENTAVGRLALMNNTSGFQNTAVGKSSMEVNTTGFANAAFGDHSLFSNTSGYDNAGIGQNALYSNADGIENTAMGNGTLYYNVAGYGNCATGNGALLNNGIVPNYITAPIASYNTATGFWSMFNNTDGANNTAIGAGSLYGNITGMNNTGLGTYSDVSLDNLSNAAAIGANSIVNASNKMRLGDPFVTIVESAAGSWTVSDGRFKTNVKEDVVGLPFIRLLRPVMYNFDAEKYDNFLSRHLSKKIIQKRKDALKNTHSNAGTIIQTGFIAQEVSEAAKKANYDFNGVHVPVNDDDNYSISYEKIVVPLVKAVQELAQENDEMKKEIAALRALINEKKEITPKKDELTPAVKQPTYQ